MNLSLWRGRAGVRGGGPAAGEGAERGFGAPASERAGVRGGAPDKRR